MYPLPEWLNPFQSTPEVEKKTVVVSPVDIVIPTSINVEISDKVKKHFETLMENANLPGPDYKEYRNALLKNASQNDEAYTIVYNILSTLGLTKEILVSSIPKYLEIIQKDIEESNRLSQMKIQNEFGERKKQLGLKVIEKQELIERIKTLESQIDLENKLIQEEEVKLSNTIREYHVAAEQLTAILKNDLEKINNLIK